MALHVNDVVSKTFSLKALSYFQHTNNSTLKPKYHLKKNKPKKKKKLLSRLLTTRLESGNFTWESSQDYCQFFKSSFFLPLKQKGKSQQSKDCTNNENDKNRGLENRRKSNRMEFFFPEINGAARCSILPSKCALQSLNQVWAIYWAQEQNRRKYKNIQLKNQIEYSSVLLRAGV